MESKVAEVARRLRALREDAGLTMQELAAAVDCNVADYAAMEGGERDFPFSFLYRCAEELDVDIVDLLTGEAPHLSRYSLVRAGAGLAIQRRAGFEYEHLAATFRAKLCEPLLVTAPYSEAEQDAPIHLSRHDGQEFDYVLSGRLRFAYDDHVEELAAGDAIYYDSSRGHGMIAVGGEPCVFIAVVLKPAHDESH